jgi:hypothetical protein
MSDWAVAASSLLLVVKTGYAAESIGLTKGRIAFTAGINHAAMEPPFSDVIMTSSSTRTIPPHRGRQAAPPA